VIFIVLRKQYFFARDVYYKYIISLLVRYFLVALGVKVGKNFFARAFPSVVLDQESDLVIGSDVILKGRVEIRAIKGACVILESGVRLDVGVRIVATNQARVLFSDGADIGCYSIFNCGDDFSIGRDCLVAGFCYFQTSDHNIKAGTAIKNQGYTHSPIKIGKGSWIAGGSFVLSGVTIGEGCVVGANSVVNKSLPSNAIAVGSPAKVIETRR
jgi:acetyltransferase-like isoleucine patch superfamily enzyme